MSNEQRSGEGAEEPIEDLDAPAASLDEVAGGDMECQPPSKVDLLCVNPTCLSTRYRCQAPTTAVVVYER